MDDHIHEWKFVYKNRWRDEERNEYTLKIYRCDCGVGRREYVPVDNLFTLMV
jgi:hypothetical protein